MFFTEIFAPHDIYSLVLSKVYNQKVQNMNDNGGQAGLKKSLILAAGLPGTFCLPRMPKNDSK